jgi:hypothetical protein
MIGHPRWILPVLWGSTNVLPGFNETMVAAEGQYELYELYSTIEQFYNFEELGNID